MKYVYYAPEQNIFGLASGNFIQFYWNNKLEESFLPVLEQEGVWIKVCEL